MTTIVSYNILAGGYNSRRTGVRRVEQLTRILLSTQPDVVGILEATNPRFPQRPFVIEEVAKRLGMQLIMLEGAWEGREYQPAVLTRLPIVYTKFHTRPGVLTRAVLEVCLQDGQGQRFTVFVAHLSAAFARGWAGNGIRKREMQEILRVMGPLREAGAPHVLMGDFNSLAPGDTFKASNLLRYVVRLDRRKQLQRLAEGHPHLDFVVPPRLRFLNPLLRLIPRSTLLSAFFDVAASLYAPRGTIALLRQAHYIDCYRRIHPREQQFTCPAAAPAGRIDFIFADPVMAAFLKQCAIVTEGDGLPGRDASDHLPVAAQFELAPKVITLDIQDVEEQTQERAAGD